MPEQLHTAAFASIYGLLQVQARTFEPISRELEARTGLPASWYEVLTRLQRDPAGERMNELADALLISRGGATKLVARLEDAGYVERVTPKSDRRATYAKLTAAGQAAVVVAHPVQLALVEEYYGRFLDDADHAAILRISAKVLGGLSSGAGAPRPAGPHPPAD